MGTITPEEFSIIKRLHLEGRGINIIAHVPQAKGGCHPFVFLRGVFPNETYEEAYKRTAHVVLQAIALQCGRACMCNDSQPNIYYITFN